MILRKVICQAGCFVYCPKVEDHVTQLMNQLDTGM